MASAIDEHLKTIRQDAYYPDPQFHASICWALLTPNENQPSASQFPRISDIPEALPSRLSSIYLDQIRATMVFDTEAINVKIGKLIHSFNLCG